MTAHFINGISFGLTVLDKLMGSLTWASVRLASAQTGK